jgi:hypothetical protein
MSNIRHFHATVGDGSRFGLGRAGASDLLVVESGSMVAPKTGKNYPSIEG